MSISQFDDAINSLQKTGAIPGAGVDPVDSAIEQVKNESKTTLQQNMFAASKTTPDRAARVANIAREISLNPRVVDRKLETLEETKSRYLDYDKIIAENPTVAQFLQNPQNASVARDDIDSLTKIDYAGRLIKPKRPNEYAGTIPEMDRAVEAGFNNLGSSANALGLAFGYGDRTTIENLAAYNKRVQEIEALRPDYSKEFGEVMGKEGADVNAAFMKLRTSYEQYQDGQIMEALKSFAVDGTKTIGEVLDMTGKALIRPKGLTYSVAENLPNALPSIGGGSFGALAGPVGLVGGAFLGGVATEIGSEVNAELSQRGVDITNPDALELAFQDVTFMEDIRGRAARKGITTAAVDAMFAMFAGGKLAKAKKGVGAAIKETGKELVQETSGEILGEFGGQVAREKGDLTKVDIGASIQEGITALGQSSAQIAAGASYRKALNPNPVKATKEIVQKTGEAVETLQKLQGINEIAEAVSGSKNVKNVPNMVGELVDMATGGKGATSVYFQVDDHDNYWSKKGVPPAKAAEDILGPAGAKAYAEAKQTGGTIEVPLSQYINSMAQTPEDLQGTLQITRVSPDGMTLNEANEHLQGVGATMKELAAEVTMQVQVEEQQQQAKPQGIKENIRKQLVDVGLTNDSAGAQAELVSSFFTTMAEREGLNADELFQSYNLRVNQANAPVEGALNQTSVDEGEIKGSIKGKAISGGQFLSDDSMDYWFEGGNKPAPTEYQNIAVLEHIEVKPEARGKGTGTKLLKEFIAAAKKGGAEAIFLNASPMGTDKVTIDALKAFYEKNGFQVYDDMGTNAIMYMPLEQDALNQGGDKNPLGQFFMLDGQANISLLENANPSTFLHETGHFFLEVFGDLAQREGATAQTKKDYENLLKFLGVESREQIKREQHEKFAEGFETYLMQGKAPSASLKRSFHKFKMWLTSVYHSLKNRGIKFTPEVTDIMDRLLATDKEIKSAIEDAKMNEMADAFPDVAKQIEDGQAVEGVNTKEFGLTGAKAERMVEAREAAEREANEKLTQKLMKDYERKRSKEYKEKKAELEEQVRAEVEQMPIYKQIDTLRLGMLPDGSPNRTGQTVGVRMMKLDRKGLDAKSLPTGILSTKKEVGISADELAGVFGYENGQAFIEALQTTPTKKDFVYSEVDRRMHQQYPDLMREYLINPEVLEEMARQEIHNDKAAQLKRMEFDALAEQSPAAMKDVMRQLSRRLPSEERMREQARAVVGRSTYQNNRPNQYRLAERKYAKLAGQAAAKGDFDAAMEHKRKEIYNFELYRASLEANEMVEKYLDKFAPIVKKSDEKLSKTRDTNLVNAARAVLATFGIGKVDKAPTDYLKQLKEYDPDSYETILALVESATQNAKEYDQVSINQFTEMADSVLALWDLAKSSRQIEINGQKMNIDEVRAELIAKVGTVAKTKGGGEHRTKSEWEKIKTGIIGVGAAMSRAEARFAAIDGSENKAFFNYVWNPVKDSLTKYRLEAGKVKNHFKSLLEPIQETLFQGEIKATELVDTRGRTFVFRSKAQLLGALLHTGNLSNLQKLLVGRGWGSVDDIGNLNRAKWDSFVNRMIETGVLTKADFDFVQGVWDMNEAYKPLAQQTHKQLTGFYFNEVTANGFSNKFGEYRGGYVPAVADMNESQDARKYDEKAFSVGVDNSFMFPTTPKGFTKSRVENYATPLSIDLEMVGSHLDKMVKYIYVEPSIKSVARVLINKDFQGALAEYDETMFESMLMPWLQRSATQVVMTPLKGQAGKFADTFLRGLRNRVAQQSMFANIVNTLQQPVGLSVASLKVKPRYLRSALWRYVKGPSALATDVANASDFMRVRLDNQLSEVNSEIKDILTDNKLEKAQDFARKHTYVLQSATQNIVDLVAWAGAYDQALENGLDHFDAVKEADSAVRVTQGGMDAEDVSRMETGNSFYRLFTMFSGYFNTQANLLGSEYVQIHRELGLRKGAGRGVYVHTFGFMIPAVMSAAIVQAFKGKLDEDDDNEYMDDVMSLFFLSQFKYATAMFPYGGNVINSAVNRWNTTVYDDAITTSPAIAMIESTVAAPKSVYDAIVEGKNTKKAVRDSLTAIGLLSGLPTYAISRPVGYMIDVNEGKADPKNPVDFARGVVSGQRGSK